MTYMGRPYYPWWLHNLADDVTGEGAAMEGAVQGAEAVRAIVVAAHELYEHQEFRFTGDYGDNGFLEDYTCHLVRSAASPPALSSRLPGTPQERPGTSW